ncbi:MAG: ferritin-like domain-containing protein [Polyangiaceae bacterium]
MTTDPTFTDRLRARLVLAAIGAIPAAGCGEAHPPPADAATSTPAASTGSPVESARPAMSAPAAPSAVPLASSAPVSVSSTQIPRSPPPDCFSPFSNARSAGTGGPGPKPPDTAYDKHGCLPFSMVTNGCCNSAVAGPRFEDGFCCYTIPTGACCGRPFTVDGEARVAPVRARSGAPTEDAAAAGWLRDARMEHASIASFARFILELLELGAPAALVRAAELALGDEIEHARACFALASRFGGQRFEAGALATRAASRRGREEIVRGAILEGCVGETVAAFLARERLARATDPEARRVLARIAEDEARHAELAWRFVAWIARTDPRAGRWIESALASVLEPEPATLCASASLESVGLLGPREESELTARALAELVRPAARALTSSIGAPS